MPHSLRSSADCRVDQSRCTVSTKGKRVVDETSLYSISDREESLGGSIDLDNSFGGRTVSWKRSLGGFEGTEKSK